MANLGVVPALVGPGDAVILDRLCHASLVDAARFSGARLFVYRHGDAEDAGKVLERAASYRRRLLVTESLFSMNGDFAPLRALADEAKRCGANTLLDEAHAIGVFGFHGRGVLGMEGMDDRWDVVVGTLSKALGSQGGFAAGSRELIEILVNRARSFIYTTGLSPVCVAAAQAALSLVQEDAEPRVRVQKLSGRLREGLRLQGWDILHSESQIIPILLGDAKTTLACADHLYQAGIFAPAIRPPTVHAGECRIRFSVTAEHEEKDIDHLLNALASFPKKDYE
jgi:8-amino-7-oxononanoate synthase